MPFFLLSTLPVLLSPSFLWWVEQFFPNKSSLISDPSALALISCLMSLPSVCCGIHTHRRRHVHTHAHVNPVCVSECSTAQNYKQSPHALVQSARLWVGSSSSALSFTRWSPSFLNLFHTHKPSKPKPSPTLKCLACTSRQEKLNRLQHPLDTLSVPVARLSRRGQRKSKTPLWHLHPFLPWHVHPCKIKLNRAGDENRTPSSDSCSYTTTGLEPHTHKHTHKQTYTHTHKHTHTHTQTLTLGWR